MSDDYGYGDVEGVVKETSSSGKYMKLEKNHKYQVRIASRPRYAIRHWVNKKPYPCTGDTCDWCKNPDADIKKKTAQWGWIVIDREDGKVKILQAPNSVALRIRDLSEIVSQKTKQKMWGDPTTFDIIIEKTQVGDGPTKYTVDPDVDSRGAMTAEEVALVKKANYNLEAEIANSKVSENVGNYGEGKPSMETLPSEVNPDDIPDDLGQEKEKSEAGQTGEDDLPF